MRIIVAKDYEALSKKAGRIIGAQLINKADSVLGLATGSTPIGTYKELIEQYNEGIIDFAKVKTFNLDEYVGIKTDDDQSYVYFMKENLFKHINIDVKNTNIPSGIAPDMDKECQNYEEKIVVAGGVDLQLLGIGNNGHIAFNEPDSNFSKMTHIVDLKEETIKANARFFATEDLVPTRAVTMGIKTIMNARKIVILASGASKAKAVYETVLGKIDPSIPSSILQLHCDVVMIIDEEAATMLPKELWNK